MAHSIFGHRATLPFYHVQIGRSGACAYGEVNVILFALLVIIITRVLKENSLF